MSIYNEYVSERHWNGSFHFDEISIWLNFRLQWEMSKWLFPMKSVMQISSNWRHFCFRDEDYSVPVTQHNSPHVIQF